ncbi:MAG: LiaI-LiaF-like domain-containing protein [Bryobacteraceae bacterium]
MPARWISALVLIALGAIFLLNNMHIVRFHDIFVYWPAILIAVGVSMLADRLAGPRAERP